jgi:hypothetical protein
LYLTKHNEQGRLAAFGAYERLDNVDYPNLKRLAESLGVTEKGLEFFEAHVEVAHFSAIEPKLRAAWKSSKVEIVDAFTFIGNHQLQLWKDLYDEVQRIEN